MILSSSSYIARASATTAEPESWWETSTIAEMKFVENVENAARNMCGSYSSLYPSPSYLLKQEYRDT